MCCTPNIPHGAHKGMGAMNCCSPTIHGQMHGFWSKKKNVQALEKYLERLREEVQDIEEYIAELRKDK
jgi:hypothetical protein